MRTLAFVFPGQGSQRAGMLAPLDGLSDFDRLLDAAEALSDLPLRDIAENGTPEQLADTRIAQPLLFLADFAWAKLVSACGIEPDYVAGHSLGEFAALAYAGVFSPEAALELVVARSRLMAESAALIPGAMAAVLGMEADVVGTVVDGVSSVWVANYNAPGQIVISGSAVGIEAATRALTDAGARKVVPLKVAGAFHSPMMSHAARAFEEVLGATHFADARIPVLQNADPRPATEAGVIRERLGGQIVSPVRWTETMTNLRAESVELLVECGPGAVLKGLARRFDGLDAVAVEDTTLEELVEEVANG